jgi:two-component system, NtrC family, response regulator HydG
MGATRGRILCVDDDKDTCDMLATLLGLSGYGVEVAHSMTDGLEYIRRGGFDLILLDQHFRDGTGIELCRMVRRFDPRTPIVFVTGDAGDGWLKSTVSAGAQAYLSKPVIPDEMLRLISELVGGNTTESLD